MAWWGEAMPMPLKPCCGAIGRTAISRAQPWYWREIKKCLESHIVKWLAGLPNAKPRYFLLQGEVVCACLGRRLLVVILPRGRGDSQKLSFSSPCATGSQRLMLEVSWWPTCPGDRRVLVTEASRWPRRPGDRGVPVTEVSRWPRRPGDRGQHTTINILMHCCYNTDKLFTTNTQKVRRQYVFNVVNF